MWDDGVQLAQFVGFYVWMEQVVVDEKHIANVADLCNLGDRIYNLRAIEVYLHGWRRQKPASALKHRGQTHRGLL